ncbi:hypothetical protein BGAL_0268g00190 [Botrytis galanthina]|uniref:Uncharacterized protein n=1 Tax=Botrytis galanthina TaxID=278940 RepID=A0A4S8QSB9_9HELO|nr:hypothetical protein BGAL_0268g00190 [Botrytis galanthina]
MLELAHGGNGSADGTIFVDSYEWPAFAPPILQLRFDGCTNDVFDTRLYTCQVIVVMDIQKIEAAMEYTL